MEYPPRVPLKRNIAKLALSDGEFMRSRHLSRRAPYAVVTGGGTAGHALPALAVARALVERGCPADSIEFVGSRWGMEARLAEEAGFHATLLPGRGLQRRLVVANIPAIAGLCVAIMQALYRMALHRPAVVISLGGYASLPFGVSAILLRVPLVVVNTDAVPGAAIRLLAHFARACAVAFEGTGLPRAVLTGAPVRDAVVRARSERGTRLGVPEQSEGDRVLSQAGALERVPGASKAGHLGVSRDDPAMQDARDELGGSSPRPLVIAFGGSLGARTINSAVAEMVRLWGARTPVDVRHVVGRRDWPEFEHRGFFDGNLRYVAVEYDEGLPEALARADVAVCRAGAGTIAELSVIGVPAVLVPLPGAPRDHQTKNAMVLVKAGAAVCVKDSELDGARLVMEVEGLLADPQRLLSMSFAARELGMPDASDRVADLALRHASGEIAGVNR